MKSPTILIGILLIAIGIMGLAYEGFTYTKREKVAELGPLQVTENTRKTVYFPPIYGVLSLGAGIVLVVIGRRNLK